MLSERLTDMSVTKIRHKFVEIEERPERGEVRANLRLVFYLEGIGECSQRHTVSVQTDDFSRKRRYKMALVGAAWDRVHLYFDGVDDDDNPNIFASIGWVDDVNDDLTIELGDILRTAA